MPRTKKQDTPVYYSLAFRAYVDFLDKYDKAKESIDARWGEPTGILHDHVLMLDLDNIDEGNAILDILDDDKVSYLYQETEHGYHVFLNNNFGIKKKVDFKCGLTLTISTLSKGNSTKLNNRPLLKSNHFNDTLSDTPIYLKQCNSSYNFYGMCEGDRNEQLSRYTLALATKGFDWNEAVKTITFINTYLLKQPIKDSDLKTILRDDTKTKFETYAKEKEYPYVDKNNVPLKVCENLKWLLDKNNITLKENLLTKEIDVFPSKDDFDNMCVDINTLCLINGFKLSLDVIRQFCIRIAAQNKYNPVKDYLEELTWDGVDRLDDLFSTIVLDDGADKELCYDYLARWLCSCVKMAYNINANDAAQGVLVLKGDQGIKKTTWLMNLSPVKGWAKEGQYLDVDKKDNVMANTRTWIIELGELRSTIKDINKLKAYITNKDDCLRLPYGRSTKNYPRLTSYCGSVNDDEFLKDETGDRRWWVIPVKSLMTDSAIDIPQLWAEVKYKTLSGKLKHYFESDELKRVISSNKAYTEKSPLYQAILDTYDFNSKTYSWKTSTDLLTELGLDINKYCKKVKQTIKDIADLYNIDADDLYKTKDGYSLYAIPEVRKACKERVEINRLNKQLKLIKSI